MKEIGIFVGEENWTFFREIFADLSSHYHTRVYKRKTYNTPLFYGRLNRWAFRQGILSILRQNDVCFFEWASELLAYASHMPNQCAVVTRLHSFELYQWAPKVNWDAVDKIILVSQAMQGKFIQVHPEQAHKTIVINNGIDLQKFIPPGVREFNFNLGMLCHIEPIKRIYEVILAVFNLRLAGLNPRLHIAGEPSGDPRYAAVLHRLVDKLDLVDYIFFHGHIEDTPNWLKKIDIFISNSYWEGQQVALLEAMATGCYCLSHFWDGADELLPQENLYLTESDLLQKIIGYSKKLQPEQHDLQNRMRTIASEKFDLERTKVEIRKVIEST